MLFSMLRSSPFRLVYDDASDAAAAEAAATAEATATAAAKAEAEATAKKGEITLTQEKLNSMMAENRRTVSKQNETLLGELNTLKEQATMTATERGDLEERLEKLQEQSMTQEEIVKRNSKKAQVAHAKELDKLTKERDTWQSNYSAERINRSILDAATAAKVEVNEQIMDILGPKTYLGEVLNEAGQPTGEYEPLVKFVDVDDDGNPTMLTLKPEDALKRMKELPERFGNLFTNPGTGGFGSTNGAGSGSGRNVTVDSLKDPAAYMKWRKENPGVDPTTLVKGKN